MDSWNDQELQDYVDQGIDLISYIRCTLPDHYSSFRQNTSHSFWWPSGEVGPKITHIFKTLWLPLVPSQFTMARSRCTDNWILDPLSLELNLGYKCDRHGNQKLDVIGGRVSPTSGPWNYLVNCKRLLLLLALEWMGWLLITALIEVARAYHLYDSNQSTLGAGFWRRKGPVDDVRRRGIQRSLLSMQYKTTRA
jgi:hypothetical protein